MNPREKKSQPPDSHFPAILFAPFRAVFGPLTRRNVLSWLYLILIVLAIRWAWFEPFTIPSGSMEPTLHGNPKFLRGDRVAVNKFYYGLRFPFNGAKIPFTNKRVWYADNYLIKGHDPQRWDVVVFRSVDSDPESKILIKRIVGLPGERIRIADGKIHVNGELVEPPASMPEVYYLTPEEMFYAYMQRVPPSERGQVAEMVREDVVKAKYGVGGDDAHSVIPEGHYFMLGDNSPQSRDGRYFGWVPRRNLLGRTFCIWWPFNRWRDFTGFSGTWWGLLLLLGIPLAFVLFELVHGLVRTSLRIGQDIPLAGLQQGDHVVVNRLAYGLRVPVTGTRTGNPKNPEQNDWIMYRIRSKDDYNKDVSIGQIVSGPSKTAGTFVVMDATREGARYTTALNDIHGRVDRVWWPLARRRSLDQRDGG